MSAEGMPQREPSLLARPLRAATRLVLRFPAGVVMLAVALAVLGVGWSVTHLGFRTSRLDLLNPESGYNRLWIEYINEFGDEDDVVVVVEGPGRETVVPVLEEISAALAQQDRFFYAVLHEVNLTKIRSKGLHYLPVEELLGIEQFLGKVEPVLRGDWARLNLGNMAGGMSARLADAQMRGSMAEKALTERELARLSDSLLTALSEQTTYRSPWPEMPGSVSTLSELNSEYLLTNEGRLGFVLLRLVKDEKQSFARGTQAIDTLRRLIDQVQAHHPNTKIGLTGLPVMESDEMRISQKSMTEASLLSLCGVACIFVAGFGGIRHPLLAIGALLLAMAWAFGYITLAVGHLNILSISFGVILIGLGIDFGVHYVARYLQLRRHVHDCGEALVETAAGVGPGVVTGALTTALAFFVAGFTEFTGVAELGVIAGGGILLCLVAAVFVLPSLLHLSDHGQPGRLLPVPLDLFGWLKPLFARPRLLLAGSLALTAALALGMGRLWYDHNLLNLQPVGLESVELERKVLSQSDQSVWFALSIADSSEELLRRKAEFLRLPSVERTEEIASLFPADEDSKRPIIQRIAARLEGLPERPPRIPVDPPAELGLVLAQAQALVAADSRTVRIERQLEQVRDALRRMPLSECYRRLSDYQQRVAGDLLSRMHTLSNMANPDPPELTDLPESLVTRFVGQRGRYLLKIYGRGSIWDMDALEQFVRQVRSVDPRVTGNPVQTYEASRAMKRSYEQAACYALLGILVVLYLDFRRLRYVLLAMFPLGLGMLQMFGVLGYLDIPLNPANMIVLPLIMGIGIDNGVHVVHDFRCQSYRYRMSPSTASAVVITSLTTMAGFGSLMVASHRGLQSLGRVLTIGVSCCLFTSLVMLPAVLSWLTRNRPGTPSEDADWQEQAGSGLDRRRDPAHVFAPHSPVVPRPVARPQESPRH